MHPSWHFGWPLHSWQTWCSQSRFDWMVCKTKWPVSVMEPLFALIKKKKSFQNGRHERCLRCMLCACVVASCTCIISSSNRCQCRHLDAVKNIKKLAQCVFCFPVAVIASGKVTWNSAPLTPCNRILIPFFFLAHLKFFSFACAARLLMFCGTPRSFLLTFPCACPFLHEVEFAKTFTGSWTQCR